MDKTKCWVAVRVFSSMWSHAVPAAVFLSKQEADFWAWKENNNRSEDGLNQLNYTYVSYLIQELTIVSQEKTGKEWDKFTKEQRVKIEAEIAKNTSHSAEDLARVEALKKEKESY